MHLREKAQNGIRNSELLFSLYTIIYFTITSMAFSSVNHIYLHWFGSVFHHSKQERLMAYSALFFLLIFTVSKAVVGQLYNNQWCSWSSTSHYNTILCNWWLHHWELWDRVMTRHCLYYVPTTFLWSLIKVFKLPWLFLKRRMNFSVYQLCVSLRDCWREEQHWQHYHWWVVILLQSLFWLKSCTKLRNSANTMQRCHNLSIC